MRGRIRAPSRDACCGTDADATRRHRSRRQVGGSTKAKRRGTGREDPLSRRSVSLRLEGSVASYGLPQGAPGAQLAHCWTQSLYAELHASNAGWSVTEHAVMHCSRVMRAVVAQASGLGSVLQA